MAILPSIMERKKALIMAVRTKVLIMAVRTKVLIMAVRTKVLIMAVRIKVLIMAVRIKVFQETVGRLCATKNVKCGLLVAGRLYV